MKLSEKMHKTGWSITLKKNGDFCVYAADGTTYTYSKSTDTWSEPVEKIETELDKQYDAVIANYVLNIVPPDDRKDIYKLIRDTLKKNGIAYLTVQGVWPVENNYKIIKKYSDGYLIKTGFNTTFRKGYTKEEFLKEIKHVLGGNPRLIIMFYSNPFMKWAKE